MKFCEICECNPCDCEDKDRPAKEHTYPKEQGFQKGVRLFDDRLGVYVLWNPQEGVSSDVETQEDT
tara:strand:+ start:2707 stop:2904 length:198 start_codon:yes stop_codon:yes gene_type:complete